MANFNQVKAAPNREPDYVSKSGSKYWYEDDGVYRQSNHWGEGVASCDWFINGNLTDYANFANTLEKDIVGFAKWNDFTNTANMTIGEQWDIFKNAEARLKDNSKSEEPKAVEKTSDMFTPSAELVEKFKNNVQNALSDSDIPLSHLLEMGTIPPLYIKLGLPESPLKTNKTTLLKAIGQIGKNPHNVPQGVLEELPTLISDPEAVFKSSPQSTNPNGFVAILNAKNEEGKQIIVAVSPNEKGEIGFNFIPSVYDKKNFENFINKTDRENGIIYIKDKDSELWGPLQLRPLHYQSLINRIQTKDKIVNSKQDLQKESEVKPMEDLKKLTGQAGKIPPPNRRKQKWTK